MAPLKQRIVWRAGPVGVATTAVGYGLLWCYLTAASTFNRGATIQSDGPSYFGPILIGLAGFAISAALECVRRKG
ncbi:MAG TPA: hypothetical protein VH120_12720 [Gemmataceae bacterium]|jgi:hypothetical protein|nr:hypothetical protein [Gemmataceae bacterium]